MFRLVIEKGSPPGAAVEFADGELVVGRSHVARLRPEAPDVSGRHLRIVVSGGQAVAENLSRFGTQLDGRPLSAPTPLEPGQRLACGASTVMRFELVAPPAASEAPPPPDEEPATGEGGPTATPPSPPSADGPRTSTPPQRPAEVTGPGDDALSQGADTSADASGEHTRPMMTRVASPDEIEFLRAAEYHRARGRMAVVVAAVVLVAAAGVVWLLRRPPPETSVAWPVDPRTGEDLVASVESPMGGFALIYPKTPDAEVAPQPGGLVATCRLGRRRDLPLRVLLDESVDPRCARETMEESIARWEAQLTQDKGTKWSFEAPLPAAPFLGGENGIPFKAIPYQREQDGSWRGVAAVFRHGRRLVAVRAEVPAADRARAEGLLYTTFADPSPDFVRTHWEGAPEIPKAPAADILTRAREELRRVAPATWEGIRRQLEAAVRRAVADDNAEQEKEALELLAALREQQALWFHEQMCKREAALMAQTDEEATAESARRVAELCKAVFSDPSDQRFYEVRKW